jgi:hypothetical protein
VTAFEHVLAERRINDPIIYMMDQGANEFPQAVQVVTEMHRTRHHDVIGLMGGSVDAFPAIQAADVVAYCARERAARTGTARVAAYLNALHEVAPSPARTFSYVERVRRTRGGP